MLDEHVAFRANHALVSALAERVGMRGCSTSEYLRRWACIIAARVSVGSQAAAVASPFAHASPPPLAACGRDPHRRWRRPAGAPPARALA